MKPPSNPAVFRTTHRHYHHNGRSRDEAWDAWIGAEQRRGAIGFRILGIVLVLALIGAAIWFFALR